MQKIVLTALSASILMTGVSPLFAESNYYETSKDTMVSKQQASSTMRMEYYNKYLAKGYDVSSIKEYLDGTTTTESEFWEALKKMQNNHEVPDRRSYVAKLEKYGYDVSAFTESVIWDSGKFWEMVKMVESGKKPVPEVKKEEYKKPEPMKNEDYKKVEPVKQEYKEEVMKKVEEKKIEMTKKVEDKKAEISQKMEEKKFVVGVKITAAKEERLVNMMKARIAKIPESSRESTLVRLQDALTK